MNPRLICCGLVLILLLHTGASAEEDGAWKAGVATRVITPQQPMWMAGYAARNKPSEGSVHDLHVKALAVEDAGGSRLVI